jgi:hypothetical protein
MKVVFDFKDLEAEHRRSLTILSIAKTRGKTRVRESSLRLKSYIKFAMPVDTGAAQSRWGEETAPGIWEVEDDGLTITQGAGLEPFEYISRLNEGSSQQAPAGFIDALVEQVAEELGDILTQEVYGAVAGT